MERLTKRINGVVVYVGAKNPYSTGQIPCEVEPAGVREMMDRLAAYEDTGLTPEQCENAKDIIESAFSDDTSKAERIRELLTADKEGRLVVLLCKVGDTVWAASGKIIKCEIDEIYLCGSGGIEFFVSFNCDGAGCKRCPFNNWTQDCSGECYCDCEYGNGSFRDSDIGKTIFLTHEQAKKALEAMKDE